jgi:hypothetical protein
MTILFLYQIINVIAALVAAIHQSPLSAWTRIVSLAASTRRNTPVANGFAAQVHI